jgi:hypothetical protein
MDALVEYSVIKWKTDAATRIAILLTGDSSWRRSSALATCDTFKGRVLTNILGGAKSVHCVFQKMIIKSVVSLSHAPHSRSTIYSSW